MQISFFFTHFKPMRCFDLGNFLYFLKVTFLFVNNRTKENSLCLCSGKLIPADLERRILEAKQKVRWPKRARGRGLSTFTYG